ncbi:MAG TPA: glycosyltransferase family 39 protein [bacterium]|nr:glycosyltransferase family 39 protein [bacterium]
MPAQSASATTFRPGPFSRRHLAAIAAVTVLGAAVRMSCLGDWSLWVDEAHTWRDATMPLSGENGFLATDRVKYGLTFLLLRLLYGAGVLGYDEWSMRLPFALAGIVTIPVVAICGRRLVGAGPAVLAAGLLAFHPWHLFWSQNARGYVVVILLSTLAIHRAHVWLGSRRVRDLLLAFWWLLLGVGSHPTAGMLAVAFGGYLLVRWATGRGERLRWWPVLLIAAFVVWPLPGWIRDHLGFEGFFGAKAKPSLPHVFETVAYFFRPSTLLAAGLALLLAPRALGRERALLLGCLLLVPMAVMVSVGGQVALVTARYGICTLPVVVWSVGLLVAEVARAGWRAAATADVALRRAGLTAALLLPALLMTDYVVMTVDYFGSQHGQRARWREAAQFVDQAAITRGRSGLRVLTTSHPTVLYYLRRKHWFQSEHDPRPNVEVHATVSWMMADGHNHEGERFHAPGAEAHLQWHLAGAERGDRLFAVMISRPELVEERGGADVLAVLERDFELALRLPCWIGPKDASIYVYLPRD